jgi:hypothetical protein
MIDVDMHHVVEPGTFDIMVGANSVDTSTVALQVVQPTFKPAEAPPTK